MINLAPFNRNNETNIDEILKETIAKIDNLIEYHNSEADSYELSDDDYTLEEALKIRANLFSKIQKGRV